MQRSGRPIATDIHYARQPAAPYDAKYFWLTNNTNTKKSGHQRRRIVMRRNRLMLPSMDRQYCAEWLSSLYQSGGDGTPC
ncbi:hypothetical protein KCP73_22390 [Salmonella enterica subsp. enterica]|nr:hypothetical protein KCP73_22390 [Salmonella enterica subsp. enterica]